MTPLVARPGSRALALLTLAAAGCSTASPAATAPPPPPAVGVEAVEVREVTPTDELTGRVEAIHDVAIRPRVSGTVTAVAYREGAVVPKGAALFAIDARPYQAALARANADLARAQARVDLAHLDVGRADKLVAANAITKAEHDTTTSTAAQATAEVQAARAAVELARLDVEFTQVRAPLAGKTGRALVSVGDYVAAGPAPTQLTDVVSVDPVYVYFTGDEQTFLRFASHTERAAVHVALGDETGYPHAGTIDFVDNRVDAATGTIRLRAVVPNPDHRLTPGLYARVQLGEGAPVQAMLVDDKAILTDQDRKYVYVLGAGDTVERRDVVLGRLVAGRRVVDKGLAAGDRVIVSGTQKVFPGGKATVAPTKTAGARP